MEAQFPLYINETKQNFSNTFPITEENRELNDIDRLNNLNNNVSRENKVIICPIYTKVFDLNSSETYITNGKDIKEEEVNKGGLQAQSTVQPAQPPSTNWASILQSSAPQVPARKITKPKATTIKAGAAAVIPAIKSNHPHLILILAQNLHTHWEYCYLKLCLIAITPYLMISQCLI